MNLQRDRTAMLTLDFQRGILERVPGTEAAVRAASMAVRAAREKKVQLIHVGLGFGEGHPEVSSANAVFAPLKERKLFVFGSPSASFHPDIVDPGESIVYKQRICAFSENQLHLILRAQGIDTLVLLGVSTSGVVLSTLRRAFDLDFRCIVLEDACFDADAEVHRVLMQKVFARQAQMTTAAAFCAAEWSQS